MKYGYGCVSSIIQGIIIYLVSSFAMPAIKQKTNIFLDYKKKTLLVFDIPITGYILLRKKILWFLMIGSNLLNKKTNQVNCIQKKNMDMDDIPGIANCVTVFFK